MIYILVKLQVKNFDALDTFERQAVKIMDKHSGRMVYALEISQEDNKGEEIHLLEFPSEEAFIAYRKDDAHKNLTELRESAITSTEVTISSKMKNYLLD